MTASPKRYDRAYFDRWYRHPGRRVTSPAALARKVAMVLAVAEYQIARPVRTVLDVGCGEAPWRAPLRRLRPNVRYLGVDPSEYVVERYGRSRDIVHGSLASLDRVAGVDDHAPYDLIVCADVLQYLPDDQVAAGLGHIARLLDGVAYVEAFTSADLLVGDRRDWHARTGDDYLQRFDDAGLVHLGLHCWIGEERVAATTEMERGRP